MSRFLLDANLSYKVARFLTDEFGFDVTRVQAPKLPDDEVIALAKAEQRVIITFDKDFGEAYHFTEHGTVGIIALRLDDQRTVVVQEALKRFFLTQANTIELSTALVIIERNRVRVVRSD